MSPDYHRTSPYFAEMSAALDQLRLSGAGAFTPHELAEHMGRKVTASQRNALAHAVKLGLLTKFRYYTERGGLGVAYQINPVGQMALDFKEEGF